MGADPELHDDDSAPAGLRGETTEANQACISTVDLSAFSMNGCLYRVRSGEENELESIA